mmetsp:Transcript_14729/g.22834  ORF Transcript_14729/g.22834 Transcript_14729/m.22834 type:complete len:236 (-) Transcript_14729:2551-3258(-)
MLRMPLLGGALYQLFTAVLGVLGAVEKCYRVFHFPEGDLVTDAVRAEENGSVPLPVSRNNLDGRSADYAALMSQVVTQAPRHRKSRLSNILAPDSHWPDLLAGGGRFKLVKYSVAVQDTRTLLLHIWLVINGELLCPEFPVPLVMITSRVAGNIVFISEDNYRRITSIRYNEIILLDKQDSSCAPAQFDEARLRPLNFLELFVHYRICLLKCHYESILELLLSLLDGILEQLFIC